MRQIDSITARGQGRWGHHIYDVALRTRRSTRSDASGLRHETEDAYYLDCPEPAGSRIFTDNSARDDFMAASFTELTLAAVDPPETVNAPHWLDAICGETLDSMTFVADYVQLHWSAGTLNAYRMPHVEAVGEAPMAPADPRHAGHLVRLLGEQARGVDEILDVGLVVTLDSARLVIPLHSDGYEIAEFNAHVIS
ncbi:hypothetical protein [Yinghuangia sp. YIM S09857]|uniref:hypothetical protein n=1 Tax=Yinghuangia sp. YIM S09857 TaxID=3436929 RepID=UPI003F53C716